MVKEPHIYNKDGLGWYIDSAGILEGPLDSRQDAQQYLQLMKVASAARTEVVCIDRECF